MAFEFTANKLTKHVTQIVDPTGVSAFLVHGTEAAVLIDTCVGMKGLTEAVRKETDLPYSILLTHGHGDHAGGVGAFEERSSAQTCSIYLHPEDLPLIKEHGMEMRMDYAAGMTGMQDLTEDQFDPEPQGHFEELADGMRFELGGVSVEIIHVPGHTKGSCCMLIPEERAILFGDACNINTLILFESGTDISTYRQSLQYLKTYESKFDTIYYSHGPASGPSALDDNIELCGRILAGTDDAVPCEFMGMPALRAAAVNELDRVDGKYGNIVYSEQMRK